MKILFKAVVLFLLSCCVYAQIDLPRQSPSASVSQTIGYTVITIDYCRPGIHGRQIWGGLVPYNKVWRTGANEATTIQFTTDATVDGNKVPAGRYSLFAIPTETEWTIILNKIDKQWGAFNYKEEEDFLRFKVKPVKSSFTERLLFSFTNITDSTASVVMNWENIQISFDLKVNVLAQAYVKIKEGIAAKPDDWQNYVTAANFAADNGVYLDDGFKWIEKAISLEPGFFPLFVKARLFMKKGEYTNALKALEKCRDAGRNDKTYGSFVAQVDFLEQEIKTKSK
jgi:hypothetical protein